MYLRRLRVLVRHVEQRGRGHERVLVLARTQPDRSDVHRARVEAPGRDREADLRGAERHRAVALTAMPGHLAGRGVDAGRDVDRDDRVARSR